MFAPARPSTAGSSSASSRCSSARRRSLREAAVPVEAVGASSAGVVKSVKYSRPTSRGSCSVGSRADEQNRDDVEAVRRTSRSAAPNNAGNGHGLEAPSSGQSLSARQEGAEGKWLVSRPEVSKIAAVVSNWSLPFLICNAFFASVHF
jgi:hypothetical protein